MPNIFFVRRLKTERQTANREKIEKKQIQRVSIVNLFMFSWRGTLDKTAHVCSKQFLLLFFSHLIFPAYQCAIGATFFSLTEAPDWIRNDWWCIGRDENNRFFSEFSKNVWISSTQRRRIFFSLFSTINISIRQLIWWQTHEAIADNNRYGINSNAMWNMIRARSQQNFEWIH